MAGTIVSDTIKSSLSTPTVFQNTSGVEIGQLCKAWVNFNGTTAVRNASFNVGSVTRNATGDYTVNFTNALADANYAVSGFADIAGSKLSVYGNYNTTAPTTSAFRIQTATSGGTTGLADGTTITLAIFR